ncbi:MAG: hypothetical protein LBS91_08315 [Clostridiales Family XIII bacterium]|nr:hypothetical protein [Clostridiales Family XIII bacterium]
MIRNKILIVLLTAIFACTGIGACGSATESFTDEVVGAVGKIASDMPSAENTYTSLEDVGRAMEEAMSRGEIELIFNVTGIDETDLQNIGDNFSTFWGSPLQYTVNSKLKDIEGIIPNQAVDVKNITNTFGLSNNYYVFAFIRNGMPIPEDKPHAQEIADALPGIAAEIFTDPAASDYDKTLAAHDWLVANLEYDDTTPEAGDKNGSFGAIVLKRTMCRGYSEALMLLLKCFTDIDVVQIIGSAHNIKAESPTPVEWVGHAWNAVRLNGNWYHIDATFDDPVGNPAGQVSHFFFGQTDTVMSGNHRWTPGYFPASTAENFLFYRADGLFAEDWDSFQETATDMLTAGNPQSFEVATRNVTIDNDNIQFIYKLRSDVEEIRWDEQRWQDIGVQAIELVYSE